MMSELENVLHAQISTPTASDSLVAHVDRLIESHRTQALLSTTGAPAAIGELARRNEGLEEAVRALALAVEKLAAADR
jgi:hypothetical protein